MKRTLLALTAAAGLLFAPALAGAASAAGATAICKDGSQYMGSSDRGACSHHGGVQQWLNAAAAESPQQQVNNVPAASPALNPAPQSSSNVAPAPQTGGSNVAIAANANGQVWVNLKSKVYHCAGDRYYGKTKKGEFLPESQAIAQGFHADHGKACARA
jgi:Protein of unknown function (DUF3761)